MGVIEVSDSNSFQSHHSNARGKLVVVDFFATWCGPCKAVAPIFEQLSNQYAKEAVFLKVDVDKCPDIAKSAGVEAMPSFGFYIEGKLLKLQKGGDPRILQDNIKTLSEQHSKYAFKGQGHVLGAQSTHPAPAAAQPHSNNNNNAQARAAPAAGRRNPWADPNFFPKGSSTAAPAAAAAAPAQSAPAGRTTLPAASLDKLTAPKQPQPPASSTAVSAPSTTSTSASPAAASSAPAADGLVPATAATTDPRIKVQSVILQQMLDMGFAPIRAEKALIMSKNKSLEDAMNWILEHQDDADIDQPLEVVGTANNASSAPATNSERKLDKINLDELDEDERVILEQMKKKEAAAPASNSNNNNNDNSSAAANAGAGKVSTLNMSHEEKMEWLANKRKEVAAKRAQEAIDKEKNAYKSNKELTHAVHDLKERIEHDAAKAAYDRKKKEEAEALKARRELQMKIAADKERRRVEQAKAMEAAKKEKELKAQQAAAAKR